MMRYIPLGGACLLIALMVSAWETRAQAPPPSGPPSRPLFQPGQLPAPPLNPFFNPLAEPRIMSGDDVGFRIEGLDGRGTPVGQLVIRVNGKWVEVDARQAARAATH